MQHRGTCMGRSQAPPSGAGSEGPVHDLPLTPGTKALELFQAICWKCCRASREPSCHREGWGRAEPGPNIMMHKTSAPRRHQPKCFLEGCLRPWFECAHPGSSLCNYLGSTPASSNCPHPVCCLGGVFLAIPPPHFLPLCISRCRRG